MTTYERSSDVYVEFYSSLRGYIDNTKEDYSDIEHIAVDRVDCAPGWHRLQVTVSNKKGHRTVFVKTSQSAAIADALDKARKPINAVACAAAAPQTTRTQQPPGRVRQ